MSTRRITFGSSAKTLSVAGLLTLLSVALGNPAPDKESARLFIREYRVKGAKKIGVEEIERAIYPYLGKGKSIADVEKARTALEKVYHEKGYQTVSVIIPQQDPTKGIIQFRVVESEIANLRVNGSRYHLPSRIKSQITSLAPGTVPNFETVKKEIVGLNQSADLKVTPRIQAGSIPGTFDVDLDVEDHFPLHGSFELNNRYNPQTSPLRANASISYGNLFQLGHTAGISYQIAPENRDDAEVASGYYLAPIHPHLSLMLSATKQNSDVSTLGGAASAGRGQILGLRALFRLPDTHSLSVGIDAKRFDDRLTIGTETIRNPINYYPASFAYSWFRKKEKSLTEVNSSLNFALRQLGDDDARFDDKRFLAKGSYIYNRFDVSHTHEIFRQWQWYGKIQGQISDQPLINTEQFAAGGWSSARGYLESTALGDQAWFLSTELRTPNFLPWIHDKFFANDEARLHVFADAGVSSIHDPLPAQDQHEEFLSVGVGGRFSLADRYHGTLDLAFPFTDFADTTQGESRLIFRTWTNF